MAGHSHPHAHHNVAQGHSHPHTEGQHHDGAGKASVKAHASGGKMKSGQPPVNKRGGNTSGRGAGYNDSLKGYGRGATNVGLKGVGKPTPKKRGQRR